MFSIIMPAYNAERTISKSIESVLSQSFDQYELLIIDDCSTDNTIEIVKSYQLKDSRIVLLQNSTNSGVAETRNKGISVAQYPYISFLDSDDYWSADKLESFYQYFQKGYSVLYSFYTRFNEEATLNLVKAPLEISYKDLLKGNCIGNLTGAYDSHKIGKVYQKNIRHEDYLMWLEILKKTDLAKCIPHNLAFYRVSNSSLSGNKLKSLSWTWNIYQKELNLGIIYSSYLMIHSVFKALSKRI